MLGALLARSCGDILATISKNEAVVLMSDTNPTAQDQSTEVTESSSSFDRILSEFEQAHTHRSPDDARQLTGTVIAVTADAVYIDIGYKTEGVLPLNLFTDKNETIEVGASLPVSVKGRNEEGYYELSRIRVAQPKNWTALEQAFAAKSVIVGTVTGVVKGGLTVDVGVRAFLPASRSGTRDAAEMEKLVGQEIYCRITKLDTADEDVVVDRRAVIEEESRSNKERRLSEMREGDVVSGTVRSLAEYGAFIDLGGVDGLLHISDIAWNRVQKPDDVLTIGQNVEAKVLKIDPAGQRISLGLKQLLPHPWEGVSQRFAQGDRVHGTVTRVTDFGAFVELEPGVEGMIHVSEMSWVKKVRKPGDLLKPGDTVEVMILGINPEEHRMSLGLKQTLDDPWASITERFSAGAEAEGPITSFTKFGAFVQIAEGVEGMVHVSEITAEKRIERPQDVLRLGENVKVKVLEINREKRQLRLSIKQLVPTGLDEYIAEHSIGDIVTGRLVSVTGDNASVELGEGIRASGKLTSDKAEASPSSSTPIDLSSLSSMLSARWKSGPATSEVKSEPARAGQIRTFRITGLDREAKKIDVQLA